MVWCCAKEYSPSIVYFDELEKLLPKKAKKPIKKMKKDIGWFLKNLKPED